MLLKVYLVLKTYRDNKTGYPTQQELADAAGVTRPTFHAAVKALEELGYVKTWRGGIGEKGKGQLVYELKKALF
ncbi:MAG: winged helix-turn-helix domain-containing protein [Candidatus Aminicenantes bacterium]|nr:winged helix-turn-helix domain-containing protein [Candidatus Aminicenantes bacterium]